MPPIEKFLANKLPEYLDYLQSMVGINSFTVNPQGVNQLAAVTAAAFSSLGFTAKFIQSSNPEFGRHLFLTHSLSNLNENKVGSNRIPTIALISHLDTVFSSEEELKNKFFWRAEGDRIYGPGTVDIKGGTVLIYMVLDALRQYHPDTFNQIQWLVALNASEEALSGDFTEALLSRLPESTLACLVFEGGTPNPDSLPLVVSRKGRATYRVRAEGRSAHAGNNHAQGANAILQISRTIQQISAFTDYTQQITFNVGTVHGGSVVNRVPHSAEATVEMRAFSPEIFNWGVEQMLGLNGSGQITSQDGFACQVQVSLTHQTAPWPENPGTQRLYEIWNQAARLFNLTTSPEKRGGLSDGNYLWQRFPTLDGLGPTGANAHCSEFSPDGSKEQEYVQPSSFIPKTLMNIEAILRLAAEFLNP